MVTLAVVNNLYGTMARVVIFGGANTMAILSFSGYFSVFYEAIFKDVFVRGRGVLVTE